MIDTSIKLFEKCFGEKPLISSFARGRVNLIGDHTDYNFGFVMPTPLSLGIEVSLTPSETGLIEGKSEIFREFKRPIHLRTDGTWLDFVKGAIDIFYDEFPKITKNLSKGIKLAIKSNLPHGSGLSSSAALGIALLKAINKLENQKMNNIKLAKLAQKIEHEFIGTKCGLMDQMVASSGIKNKAMFFDVKIEKIENLALFKNNKFLVVHSGSHRKLSNSMYNERKAECDNASRILKIKNLREADEQMLNNLNGKLLKRAKHVISENERVKVCRYALHSQNAKLFGEKMYESHKSLSEDYEVSSEILDKIIDKSKSLNLFGARLTGAGFGGCCVLLVDKGKSKETFKALSYYFPSLSLIDII